MSNRKSLCTKQKLAVSLLLAAVIGLSSVSSQAQRAFLVYDASVDQVIDSLHPRKLSYPASLTKLMTLYVLFERLESGEIALTDELSVSHRAAATAPKKMGLRAGSLIDVGTAIKALTVYSANDVAVVIAEALAQSEAGFAQQMNRHAARLKMTDSHFENASGLPHPAQVTSARDMTYLTLALQRQFPQYGHYFAAREFTFAGRVYRSHNHFVVNYPGSRGMKTGFTCRAGYNLVASATRDGKSLIGVVLGESTTQARRTRISNLLNAAFSGAVKSSPDVLDALAVDEAQRKPNRTFIADECINPTAGGRTYRVSKWSVEIGLEVAKSDAIAASNRFIKTYRQQLRGGRPLLIPTWARDMIYRVGVTGLSNDNALQACLLARQRDEHCVVLPEPTATQALDRALKTMKWLALQQSQSE